MSGRVKRREFITLLGGLAAVTGADSRRHKT